MTSETNSSPNYFDVHAHVQFSAFDDDRDSVLDRARDGGVWMINVGTQIDTSRNAVLLAAGRTGVFASVGLHPIHTSASYHDEKELGVGGNGGFTSRGEEFDFDEYLSLASNEKVVAIGECGLDYYHLDDGLKSRQIEVLEAQIDLANKLSKPLMLHVRNAYEDAFDIVSRMSKVKGDLHFFAGDWSIAKKFLDFGFTLSFTGVVTYGRKAGSLHPDYAEIIRKMPLDMILSETDSPYVSPVPYRGKRNEPVFVSAVVSEIAKIKNMDEGEVATQIVANARRVFGI